MKKKMRHNPASGMAGFFMSAVLSGCQTPLPEWYEHPGSRSLKHTSFKTLQDLSGIYESSESVRIPEKGELLNLQEQVKNSQLLTKYTDYLKKKKVPGPWSWKWQSISSLSHLPQAPFVTPFHVNNSLIWAFQDDQPVMGFRPMSVRLDGRNTAASFQLIFRPDGSVHDLLTDEKHPFLLDDLSPAPENLPASLIRLAKKPPALLAGVRQPLDLTYNRGEEGPQTLEAFRKILPANASYPAWAVYQGATGAESVLHPAKFHKKTPAKDRFYQDLSNLTSCYLQINFEACLSRFVKYQDKKIQLPSYESKIASHIMTELLGLYFEETESRDLNITFILGIIEKSSESLLGASQNDFQSVLLRVLKRNDGTSLIAALLQKSKTVPKMHPGFLHHLQVLTVCLAQDLDTLNSIASEDDLYTMTTFLKGHPAIFNRYVKSLHNMGLTPFSEPVMAYFKLYFPEYSEDIFKIFPPASQNSITKMLSQLKTEHVTALKKRYQPDKGIIPVVSAVLSLEGSESATFPGPGNGFKFLLFINSADPYSTRLVKKILSETSEAFLRHVQLTDIMKSSEEEAEKFILKTGLSGSPLAKRFYRIPLNEETTNFYESLNLYSIPRIMLLSHNNKIMGFDEKIPHSFRSWERDMAWLYEIIKKNS